MVDAHLHLSDPRILSQRETLLRNACPAGITAAITCAVRPEEWQQLPAESPLPLTFAFGIHPWYAHACTGETLTALRELLIRHPSACIGEIGLDGCRAEPNQEAALLAQLELAADLRRPVILHCVRTWGKLFDTLLPWREKIPGWLIHGVNCSPELLTHPFCSHSTVFFSIGSFTRPLTEKRAALLRTLPGDRLLIESDAPDGLLPERSWSKTLSDTLTRLASLRNISPADLEAQCSANAFRFLSCR